MCVAFYVNRDAKNCCELADLGGGKELSDALELSILYQPTDDVMALYEEENR